MKKTMLTLFIVAISTAIFGNEEDNITTIVHKWNEIHNTRDFEKFKDMYAPDVLFYGRNYSGNKCYQRKKVFVKSSYYQEIISPISFTYYSSGVIKCSFTKRVKFKKSVKEHFSYLLIQKLGDNYLISGESDLLTDENLNVKLDLGKEVTKTNINYMLLYGFGFVLLMSSGLIIYKSKQKKNGYVDQIKLKKALNEDQSKQIKNEIDENKFGDNKNDEKLENVKKTFSSETIEKIKGDKFEKFVVERFKKDFFELIEWRSDKYHEGRYPTSSMMPDLEYNFRTNYRDCKFAVECKWRNEFHKERIEWAKDYQLKNYRQYSILNRVEVFVILGVGGEPDKPETLYIIPLRDINSNTLSKNYLKKYQRHSRSDFFLNADLMVLQ